MHGDWVGMMVRADVERDGLRAARFQFVRHNAANETTPCTLADESAAFDRLAQGGAALSAAATGSGSFSSDQATTRSACSTLPLVSGASTSERAKLSAPTQVPIIIGIA